MLVSNAAVSCWLNANVSVGQLVNSMAAANQEISPALQSLAMKDQKFKKGQTRQKKGSIQGPAGAKRRVNQLSSLFSSHILRAEHSLAHRTH